MLAFRPKSPRQLAYAMHSLRNAQLNEHEPRKLGLKLGNALLNRGQALKAAFGIDKYTVGQPDSCHFLTPLDRIAFTEHPV